MTVWGHAFGRHLGLGLLAAAGVGLAEGAVALAALERADPGAWLGPVLAAAVMAPAGIVVGAGGFVLVTAALGPLRAAARAVPADARLPMSIATAALAAAMAWAGGRYVRFAGELQDPAFAQDLAVFCVALSCAALPVVALAIATGLRGVQHVLPRASTAWRAWAAAAGEALAFVASAALLAAFVREHEAVLGPLFVLPYGCLLAVVLGALARSCRGLFKGRRAARANAVTALVAFALAAVGLSALRSADAVVRLTLGPSRLSALFERIADVDRDGQAGLFGGRDARRRAAGARSAGEALPAELVARRNVVLIVVDAMRADRLGLGAPASLTPVLDQLAKRSVVFTEAFSQSSTTRIAFPSFLSGKDPTSLTWVRKRGWLQSAGAEPLLSELLQRAGYTTGLVINGWIRDRLTQIQRGYEIVLSNREAGSAKIAPQLNGASSTARAIEFIERALLAHKPFFLTLYYEGPHAPYDDPTPYGVAPRGTRPIDRYDAEVRYSDRQIGHVLEHLSVQPETADNTIVIVTADHGEEFGEHGGAQHSRQCYRESTHVPLIVHAPGLPPAIVRTRVALTNIAPTVLALVGAPVPPALDGVNLLAANPARYAAAVDQSVSCAYFDDKNPNRTRVQAVRDRGLLYIERLSGGSRELYDTTADRGERTNLAREPVRLALIDRLKREIRPLQIRD